MSSTISDSSQIRIQVSPQEEVVGIEGLPPGWKSQAAIAGTFVVIGVLAAPTPLKRGMYFLETATSATTLVYGVYKTVSAGMNYLNGNSSSKTYSQLKKGLALTVIGGGTFALAQTQMFTSLNLGP